MKIMFSTFWKWPYDSENHLGEGRQSYRTQDQYRKINCIATIFKKYFYTRNKQSKNETILFTVSKIIEKLHINF